MIEEIKQKACELATLAFPDENNVYARDNIEKKICESACINMAEYTCKKMVDEMVDWLKSHMLGLDMGKYPMYPPNFIERLKEAMEG